MSVADKIILWFGAKHSGKTGAASELTRRLRAQGFTVAGLLAPSVYVNGKLVGFDALDLRTNKRARLATRKPGKNGAGLFSFTTAGINLGRRALSLAQAQSGDLIVVDEFGPVELKGEGWRRQVDLLLTETNVVVLLVVREELLQEVERLYGEYGGRTIAAAGNDSIELVLDMLRQRRFAGLQNDKA